MPPSEVEGQRTRSLAQICQAFRIFFPAGALLGLSRAAAYTAAKTGAIPTLRIGRRLFVQTHKFREMLGLNERPVATPGVSAHIAGSPAGSLDPTLRNAIVAAAEAFLHVMKNSDKP